MITKIFMKPRQIKCEGRISMKYRYPGEDNEYAFKEQKNVEISNIRIKCRKVQVIWNCTFCQ